MNIKGIEIENPYRYRSYYIGKQPCYDIQNNNYFPKCDKKVKGIYYEQGAKGNDKITIAFDDGAVTKIIVDGGLVLIHY